jgi:hypothetical protein
MDVGWFKHYASYHKHSAYTVHVVVAKNICAVSGRSDRLYTVDLALYSNFTGSKFYCRKSCHKTCN